MTNKPDLVMPFWDSTLLPCLGGTRSSKVYSKFTQKAFEMKNSSNLTVREHLTRRYKGVNTSS